MTRSPWTDEDRALLLALTLYEESLCSGPCGQPKAQAHHPDNNGWYEVADNTKPEHPPAPVCEACAAIEAWRADNKSEDVADGLFPVLVHDRDYQAKPLPPLPTTR